MKPFAPLIITTILLLASQALAAEPEAKPVRYTGPSAASLATPYRGPLAFQPRVLAAERQAAHQRDPDTRASTWRYYYSVPSYYFGSYYSGYRWYGAHYRFRGGRYFNSVGWGYGA